MSNELYRDFIDGKADAIINSLGGTITPANAELYRDFLDRKFDDVINAIAGFNPIKSFTYTGLGSLTNAITFPEKPKFILAIFSQHTANGVTTTTPFGYGTPYTFVDLGTVDLNTAPSTRTAILTYNDNVITVNAGTSERALNRNNSTYTVYYI